MLIQRLLRCALVALFLGDSRSSQLLVDRNAGSQSPQIVAQSNMYSKGNSLSVRTSFRTRDHEMLRRSPVAAPMRIPGPQQPNFAYHGDYASFEDYWHRYAEPRNQRAMLGLGILLEQVSSTILPPERRRAAWRNARSLTSNCNKRFSGEMMDAHNVYGKSAKDMELLKSILDTHSSIWTDVEAVLHNMPVSYTVWQLLGQTNVYEDREISAGSKGSVEKRSLCC